MTRRNLLSALGIWAAVSESKANYELADEAPDPKFVPQCPMIAERPMRFTVTMKQE